MRECLKDLLFLSAKVPNEIRTSIHIKHEDKNSYVSHDATLIETVECNTVEFVAEVPTWKATQIRFCKEHTVEAPVP